MRPIAPLALAALAFVALGCNRDGDAADGGSSTDLDDIKEAPVFDQAAYLLGFQVGQQMSQDTTIQIDPDVFIAGFREGLTGDSLRFTEDEARQVEQTLQDTLFLRQLTEQAATNPEAREFLSEVARNRTSADSFMTANGRRDSVETTESGLQYILREPGTGASPERGERVRIEYSGRLIDGTEFDRNQPGEPAEFVMGSAIPGMNEALLAMKPGERRTLYIPPQLAYGLSGVPGAEGRTRIPPNTPLIFDLTLVEIVETPPGGGALTPEMLQEMMRQQGAQGGGAPPGAPTAPPGN